MRLVDGSEYGIEGLVTLKPLYEYPSIYVQINGAKLKQFNVGVGLFQRCILLLLLFIIFMARIDMCNQVVSSIETDEYRISQLEFADYIIQLNLSEGDLQHALDRFSAKWCTAGIKSVQ